MQLPDKIPAPRVNYPDKLKLKRKSAPIRRIIAWSMSAAAVAVVAITLIFQTTDTVSDPTTTIIVNTIANNSSNIDSDTTATKSDTSTQAANSVVSTQTQQSQVDVQTQIGQQQAKKHRQSYESHTATTNYASNSENTTVNRIEIEPVAANHTLLAASLTVETPSIGHESLDIKMPTRHKKVTFGEALIAITRSRIEETISELPRIELAKIDLPTIKEVLF